METNKIIAAFLVAGIIAMLAGFIAHKTIQPETLAENAYKIEAIAPAAAGAAPAVAAAAEPIKDLLAKADAAQGEKVSKVCSSCHTFGKGEPNRVGPNLAGIVGKARGSAAGFAYSDAMKAKGGSWDADSLNEFLWSPKAFVPGTKMGFAGLKKPEDRAALIKWLQSQK
ncbi:MAG: cytochrome c family protein [Alphaproteobacteria bacterium]|nr:cytochrome c family protein [Alphaproteobacteria bacterium]